MTPRTRKQLLRGAASVNRLLRAAEAANHPGRKVTLLARAKRILIALQNHEAVRSGIASVTDAETAWKEIAERERLWLEAGHYNLAEESPR